MTEKLSGNLNFHFVKSKLLHNLYRFLDLNLVVVCRLLSFARKVGIAFSVFLFFFFEKGGADCWAHGAEQATRCLSFHFSFFFSIFYYWWPGSCYLLPFLLLYIFFKKYRSFVDLECPFGSNRTKSNQQNRTNQTPIQNIGSVRFGRFSIQNRKFCAAFFFIFKIVKKT